MKHPLPPPSHCTVMEHNTIYQYSASALPSRVHFESSLSVVQGAAQKRAIVRTFFSGTAGLEVRGVFAQGWRSP